MEIGFHTGTALRTMLQSSHMMLHPFSRDLLEILNMNIAHIP